MTMVFLNIPAENYPNKAFLVPNLRIFNFAGNFAFSKIWGCFRYDNSFINLKSSI